MRATYLVVATALLFSATACSASKSSGANKTSGPSQKAMPNVTGQKLDVAEDAIKSAGGDPDKIKEIGGGKFGIVVKSNWQVCSQSPKAGEALPATPQLTVARSCAASTPTSSAPASSTAASGGSGTPAPLTVKTSKDLAALLKVGDGCDPPVKAFATKFAGQDIEFDGSISALAPHGSYKTRYDILVAPGDKGADSTVGPNLQFQNVNTTTDLHYKGSVPDSIGVGTKLHVVAEVGEYNSTTCLFQLTPVSTQVR